MQFDPFGFVTAELVLFKADGGRATVVLEIMVAFDGISVGKAPCDTVTVEVIVWAGEEMVETVARPVMVSVTVETEPGWKNWMMMMFTVIELSLELEPELLDPD